MSNDFASDLLPNSIKKSTRKIRTKSIKCNAKTLGKGRVDLHVVDKFCKKKKLILLLGKMCLK